MNEGQLEIAERHLTSIDGGVSSEAAEEAARLRGRQEAALRVVEGYERALNSLALSDHDERRWYRDRLRDARTSAGLAPVELLPPVREQPRAQQQLA